MYVFEGCKGYLRTIPLMMYDAHAVEDLDTSTEDRYRELSVSYTHLTLQTNREV